MAPSITSLQDAYIISATRTPIGSFNGSLKKLTAVELGTTAVKAAIERAGIKPENVEEVLMGNVIQANAGQAPARQVAIAAGCPVSTEATTINKVCASGMKTIALAAQSIMLGQRGIIAAGGMESMSNAPFYIARQNPTFGHGALTDGLVKDGLFDVYNKFPMGNCAEKTAKDHSITREEQDNFAIESYKRSAEAWKAGVFKNEVVPVTIADKKGAVTIEEDEEYKNVKMEKIPTLRPVFDPKEGTVTAANASTLNDGASAVIVASEAEIKKHGLKPLAKIISFADAAVDPIDFPVAPAKAIPIALERAGLTKEDISLWEVNEAFASVPIANGKILGIDMSKVNINGGGVSLGHPIGSSGCRIVVTLAHALKPGQYGCAGVCNGGGGASAIIIKREA